MSNFLNRSGLNLTFRDGLNFGCGLWVSLLAFWLGLSLLGACLMGILTALGIGGLDMLQ
ncbi:MAG: hypothetical protein Kow0063_41430 [Anaerolineae bacterium]